MASLALWCAGCSPSPEGGAPERVLGEAGSFPGQFSYPRAIDQDSEALWVIDKSARVQRLDPETGRASVWWRMPDFQLGKPVGVSVARWPGADGSLVDALIVPDTHYQRVIIYSLDASNDGSEVADRAIEFAPVELARFGRYGTGPGEFIYPTDAAVLESDDRTRVERLYISEYGGNDRVSVFDASLVFLFAFGSHGAGADQFARPQSIAIDERTRELIIADSCNHRIGRFTLDGRPLGWVETPAADGPTEGGAFAYPYGVFVLPDSSVLVAEFGSSRVRRVDPRTGRVLGAWGVPGRAPGQLAAPWGVTWREGELFVLDSGNNRVQVFRGPALRATLAWRGASP